MRSVGGSGLAKFLAMSHRVTEESNGILQYCVVGVLAKN